MEGGINGLEFSEDYCGSDWEQGFGVAVEELGGAGLINLKELLETSFLYEPFSSHLSHII